MHTPIKIPKNTSNAYAKIINYIYAIICGVSNLTSGAKLYNFISGEKQAKLFQQLNNREAKVMSLASQYQLHEEAYNDNLLEIL